MMTRTSFESRNSNPAMWEPYRRDKLIELLHKARVGEMGIMIYPLFLAKVWQTLRGPSILISEDNSWPCDGCNSLQDLCGI